MFVKKSTADALEEEIHRLHAIINGNTDHIKCIENAIEIRTREIKEVLESLEEKNKLVKSLAKKIDELESGIVEKSDHTSATLHISDDLETVTPITRVRPETINKLVEKKYLPSNKRDDEFAINLAVMLVGFEAMEQIIFSFEEALKDDVEFTDGAEE